MVAEGARDPREKKERNKQKTPVLLRILISFPSSAIGQSHPRIKERENKLYFMMGGTILNLKPNLIPSRQRGHKEVCLMHTPPMNF